MNEYYKLGDKGSAVPCDVLEWAKMYEESSRVVAKTALPYFDCEVSTVFLGLEHGFKGGRPLLFETMIFGGDHDQFQVRCCTWREAVTQHCDTVEMVNANQESTPQP